MNTQADAYLPPPPIIPPAGLFADFVEDDDEPDIFDLPYDPPEIVAEAPQSAENVADEQISASPEIEAAEDAQDAKAQGSVTLRHYQKASVRETLRQLKGDKANGLEPCKSTLNVMATGTGKSVIIADLARQANSWEHAVLLLVHRDELIRQLSRSCARVGIHALIEKAGERALPGFGIFSKTVCASVQTLKGKRLEQWPQDAFKLIITDEAHHACAKGGSYTDIYKYFGVNENRAKHVGFTATADRLDGVGLGKVFDSLAFEYNIRDAIHDPVGPFLVPIEAFPIETEPPIDLKSLRITAGDFNTGDLEKAINENIGVLVNAIVDNDALGTRRTLAFTPDIKSAEALSYALRDVGITSNWVSGNSPDRARIFKGHQSGEFQVLVNCMIATEGYDDPEISCVLICRPTKSRALYSQMVGRGTRLHPESNKQSCRIVDFAYLTGTHALVSPVDLYDNSDTADAVVVRARELIEKGETRDIDAALEQAGMEFEESERVRIQRKVVKSRAKTFNPIDAFDILGIKQKADYNWNDTKAATPKMIEYGRKCGVELPDDASFGTTKKILDAISTRRKYNLATMKQVALCMRLAEQSGLEIRHESIRRMSFDEATRFISENKSWP